VIASLDGDEHGAGGDDGASFDLCLGLAITAVVVFLVAFVPI